MKITLGDTAVVYGCLGRNVDYAGRRILRMRDPINKEHLEKAVRNTQKRYPYFSVRLVKNDSEYYYEKNDLPVVLLNTDERITLNAPESNYHSWAVCYKDDCIIVEYYHGLMDGTGMYKLLATLLYYYCHYRYGITDHEGIRTLEDEILPDETRDPVEALPEIEIMGKPAAAPREAYSLINDGGLRADQPTVIDIEMNEADFVKFSSDNDASPGTMTALLLERAIDKWAGEPEKPVACTYIINARPMLNCSESFHNCLAAAVFVYDKRMKALPFGTQTTCHRGITFVASDETRVIPSLKSMAQAVSDIIGKCPSLEEKKAAFAAALNAGRPYQTAMVSYVGRWRFPAIGDYVEEFWTHAPAVNDFFISISAINGKIFFSIQQLFDSDEIINAFLAQLDEFGIDYKVKSKKALDTAFYAEPEMR